MADYFGALHPPVAKVYETGTAKPRQDHAGGSAISNPDTPIRIHPMLSATRRLRWHEVPALLAIVLIPLNSHGNLAAIASSNGKAAAGGLAVISILVVIGFGTRWRPRALHIGMLRLVTMYALSMLISSLVVGTGQQRWLLFGQFLLSIWLWRVMDAGEAYRFFIVVYWASIIHLVLAIVTGGRSESTIGVSRFSGGSHPTILGFESSILVAVTLWRIRSKRRGEINLPFEMGILGLAIAGLLLSFSRTSLIGLGLGLWLGSTLDRRGFSILRLTLVTVPVMVGAGILMSQIEGFLGQQNVQGLSTATGRTTIWGVLLDAIGAHPLRGYGYASLNDAFGADAEWYALTNNLPSENSILQATLMGGVIGGILFIAILAKGLIPLLGPPESRWIGVVGGVVVLTSVGASNGVAGLSIQWWWLLALSTAAGSRGRQLYRAVTRTSSKHNTSIGHLNEQIGRRSP